MAGPLRRRDAGGHAGAVARPARHGRARRMAEDGEGPDRRAPQRLDRYVSALSILGLTSPIMSSIERIAVLCGVFPTLNEKHTCTGLVARISATSLSTTVSTSPISRSL